MDKENAYEIEKKFYTQQEVADLFRVSPGTIKNWRDAGLLDFFQVPGSTRVLYPIDAVNQFQSEHMKHAKVMPLRRPEVIKKADRQDLSSDRIKKVWRI
jgi:hypothetical protein